jgi:hypothetical protein
MVALDHQRGLDHFDEWERDLHTHTHTHTQTCHILYSGVVGKRASLLVQRIYIIIYWLRSSCIGFSCSVEHVKKRSYSFWHLGCWILITYGWGRVGWSFIKSFCWGCEIIISGLDEVCVSFVVGLCKKRASDI